MNSLCSFPSSQALLRVFLYAGASVLASQLAIAQQTVSLRGRVTTKDGAVIPMGVTVALESAEGMPVAREPADASGQFSFDGLAKMNYKIAVTCDGFETYTQDVELAFGADQYNLNVVLSPLNARKPAKAAPLISDQSASKTAVKYFETAERALQKKKSRAARESFERALAASPCYARALAELALVDIADRRLDAAEAHFLKAIQCDGAFLDPYSELAELYKVEKRYARSEAVLRQAIQRSPQTWQLYDRLGETHYTMGKYKESEQDYLRVLALNPAPPADVHAHLANVYLKERAYEKAFSEMMNYMRLDPSGRFAPSIKRVTRQMEAGGLISGSQAQAGNTPPKSR